MARISLSFVLGAGGAVLLAGCVGPGATTRPAQDDQQRIARLARQQLERNVVAVHAYYDSFDPWIWNEEQTRPQGVSVKALYLEGPKLGCFGDGILRPRVLVQELDASGAEHWRLVWQEALDVEQAYPFRGRKPKAQGYGYRLPLVWGKDLDLSGKQIRVIVGFERRDGLTIYSPKKDFRVPRGTMAGGPAMPSAPPASRPAA